jgi:broad specificity phosphatase PhoE
MMRKLIVIKHSKPRVEPGVAAHLWGLGPEGEKLCGPLAKAVGVYGPGVIVTSEEPKAAETGRLVGEGLGVPVETAAGLQEHDRSNVPHMQSGEFISSVANFFRQPERLVLGRETAREAGDRFERAVEAVLAERGEECVAIVSHGTVISLLAERKAGLEPFALWRRLGLPSFIVFELPGWTTIEMIERV